MVSLPTSITSGDTGHIGHHESLHAGLTVESVTDPAHGAVGDGTTDDTAAIQSAIDAAGDKPVWLPPGTYIVTAASSSNQWALNMPANAMLVGASRRATTIQTDGSADTSANNRMVRVAAGCTIANLTLDNNARNNAGADPGGTDGDGHCIDTDSTDTSGANDVIIRHIRCYDARNYGINPASDSSSGESNDNWHILDVEMIDCGWDGIDAKALHNSQIVKVTAINCGRNGLGLRPDRCTITNVLVKDCGWEGITILASRTSGKAEATISDVVALNCGSGNTTSGIKVFYDDVQATVEGFVTLSNIVSRNNAKHGIFRTIQSTVGCHTQISNVICDGNTESGVFCDAGGDASVTGSRLANNGAYGFDNNGVDERHLVVGNIAYGNTSGQIRGAGASALHANNLES